MLTRSKAQAARWSLCQWRCTPDVEIRTTECEADTRLQWEVTTPRGKARKTRAPTSAFLVVAGGATTRHRTMREALAALNALGQQEAAHG